MAKVTFWQPTDMAELVSFSPTEAKQTAGIFELSSNGASGYFSLVGDDFEHDFDFFNLLAGTVRAAAIDTTDDDYMPNIIVEFPNGYPVTTVLDVISAPLTALGTLLGKGDTIKGSDGDDGIRGFKGNDKISGREGNDTLTGDEGKDKFIFDTKLNAATNVDFIADFEVNKDTIRLDRDIFKKIGDKLNAKEFRAGTKAKDGNDRIIYDDETGTLYHDKNGDKAGKKTVFAFLPTNLALDHKDFDMFD